MDTHNQHIDRDRHCLAVVKAPHAYIFKAGSQKSVVNSCALIRACMAGKVYCRTFDAAGCQDLIHAFPLSSQFAKLQ